MAPAAVGPDPRAVSVVVCTHERPHYLETCLAALAPQTAGNDRAALIVVDSASSAAAAERIASLARDAGAHLLRLEAAGLSAARNAGLAASQGAWTAFLDDDAIVADDWLARLNAAIAGLPPTAAGLGGWIEPLWEAPLPAWWPPDLVPALTVLRHDRAGQVGRDLPDWVEPYGANMAFHTARLAAIGGFSADLGRVGDRLLSGEETFAARRLRQQGATVHYDPGVRVRHAIQAHRLAPRWLLDRQYWSGVSEALTMALLGERADLKRKAARMAVLTALRAPLLLVPADSTRFVGRRAGVTFAAGFVRGAWTALRA